MRHALALALGGCVIGGQVYVIWDLAILPILRRFGLTRRVGYLDCLERRIWNYLTPRSWNVSDDFGEYRSSEFRHKVVGR